MFRFKDISNTQWIIGGIVLALLLVPVTFVRKLERINPDRKDGFQSQNYIYLGLPFSPPRPEEKIIAIQTKRSVYGFVWYSDTKEFSAPVRWLCQAVFWVKGDKYHEEHL